MKGGKHEERFSNTQYIPNKTLYSCCMGLFCFPLICFQKIDAHTMKRNFLAILLLLGTAALAQDTMVVTLNKPGFQPGDTLSFTAMYKPWQLSRRNATLNLWMEDVHHTAVWRLRYPMLAGEALGDLILPAHMPADVYALHFSLAYKDKQVKLTMMLPDRELLSQAITLNEQKEFAIRKVLFADRARVYFAPIRPNRENDLEVELDVSLDSAFVPVDETTLMVTVGQVEAGPVAKEYRFNRGLFTGEAEGTLQSVEVIGKKKTPLEKFEEIRVGPLFKTQDAYQFDGLGSQQFLGWINILEWLRGRVPGLRIEPAGTGMMNYTAQWQGSETFFFLNEMQVDAQTLAMVPTADIAMVKVMRPPFYGAYLGGAGGAVCVYTKDGGTLSVGPRHSFMVNGYTPETFLLPVRQEKP